MYKMNLDILVLCFYFYLTYNVSLKEFIYNLYLLLSHHVFRMMKTVIIALCLGLALAAPQKNGAKTKPVVKAAPHPIAKAANETWEKPAFCKTLDCPVYALLDSNAAEVRYLPFL